MILKTFIKQPNEFKDYDIDYSPWLKSPEDTLNDVVVSVECMDDPEDTSLELVRNEITIERLKIWLRGGTAGYTYKVTLLAQSVGDRVDESELLFVIEDF